MLNNSKIKKYISSALAFAVIVSGMAIGMFAYAGDGTPITEDYFPDEVWRTLVTNYLDYDRDGMLSKEEIDSTVTMDVSGFLESEYGAGTEVEIADLTGIELFTSLKRLRIGGLGLEALNVSALTELESLTCQGNYLDQLHLENNSNLTELNCSANFLEHLDLSQLVNLERLSCHTNYLEELDLSKQTALTFLSVYQNELTELDLSKNTLLKTLNCSSNHLRELDLSNNTALEDVFEKNLGNQTASSYTYIGSDGIVYANFPIDNPSGIAHTTLDTFKDVVETDEESNESVVTVRVVAYNDGKFYTSEPEKVVDGIDYYYDVNLEGAENMKVHVDTKKTFCVVRYYDSADLKNKIGQEVVNKGEAATFELSEVPVCKIFVSWSEDRSEVNDDLQIYAIWREDHNLQITAYDRGIVTAVCTKEGCGAEKTYKFDSYINAKSGDDNYEEVLDLNSDGVINAKDFARLARGAY